MCPAFRLLKSPSIPKIPATPASLLAAIDNLSVKCQEPNITIRNPFSSFPVIA